MLLNLGQPRRPALTHPQLAAAAALSRQWDAHNAATAARTGAAEAADAQAQFPPELLKHFSPEQLKHFKETEQWRKHGRCANGMLPWWAYYDYTGNELAELMDPADYPEWTGGPVTEQQILDRMTSVERAGRAQTERELAHWGAWIAREQPLFGDAELYIWKKGYRAEAERRQAIELFKLDKGMRMHLVGQSGQPHAAARARAARQRAQLAHMGASAESTQPPFPQRQPLLRKRACATGLNWWGPEECHPEWYKYRMNPDDYYESTRGEIYEWEILDTIEYVEQETREKMEQLLASQSAFLMQKLPATSRTELYLYQKFQRAESEMMATLEFIKTDKGWRKYLLFGEDPDKPTQEQVDDFLRKLGPPVTY